VAQGSKNAAPFASQGYNELRATNKSNADSKFSLSKGQNQRAESGMVMPPLKQTSQLPETNAMRSNQVYTRVLSQQKETTFKVQKNKAKSGFGDFYGNAKPFEP
jgi:hypothetical protein